jgi:hypothetical protein
MPQMLELIRASQVPSNLMQSAARGSLAVPPEEMIEILVYLALHHKLFGEQARLTLAGWDEKASRAVAANTATSPEVLGYLTSVQNLRIVLLPQLAENPSVTEESLASLAVSGSRAVVDVLLPSPRVTSSARLLQALQTNPNLRPNELSDVGQKLAGVETVADTDTDTSDYESIDADSFDDIIKNSVSKYFEEHAAELAAEKEEPFKPIGMSLDGEEHSDLEEAARVPSAEHAAADVESSKLAAQTEEAASVAARAAQKAASLKSDRRDSTLQKISKLDIRGRITLAMRGNKEERSILIRDSTKLVALAVLDSPKISDGEVEKIALQKNVLEAVLRAIPMRRRFAKNYNITRNLVQNPRTPLDLALGMMKNLMVHDLKNLSGNKEVSDTIRKLALRMFKQRVEKKN